MGRKTAENTFDVIIVGAGPAGIFAAWELGRAGMRVCLLEKGNDLEQRRCLLKSGSSCGHCRVCSITSGWGGAGAFSDGKLTLSPRIGGWLADYLGEDRLEELISYVDDVYVRCGAPSKVYSLKGDRLEQLQREATLAELTLVPASLRHLGTERARTVLRNLRSALQGANVTIRFGVKVDRIVVEDGCLQGVACGRTTYRAPYVVVAPGREGAEWLLGEGRRLGLATETNPVDLGVRVEVPAAVMERLTQGIYESKLLYHSRSFDDKVRTFCVCPYGEVTLENNDGLLTVNGHSYAERKTGNTNFALLVSKTFTEPFKEPIAYGKHIARLANLLGGGVIVQRLGDLTDGRRSTPKRIKRGLVQPTLRDATPGDLSLVLPYRYLVDIMEMLQALDKMAPGLYSRHTLLYGVEVKFYSARFSLSNQLETDVKNLYAVGDGAGVTRGLMQASVSGVVAARDILSRNRSDR